MAALAGRPSIEAVADEAEMRSRDSERVAMESRRGSMTTGGEDKGDTQCPFRRHPRPWETLGFSAGRARASTGCHETLWRGQTGWRNGRRVLPNSVLAVDFAQDAFACSLLGLLVAR